MAVTFDASSSAAAVSQNQSSFNWNHSGGTPKGVAIFTFTLAELDILAGDNVTSVTYGGVSVPAVSGGRAESVSTMSGDEHDCKLWFLGSGVPAGTQSVVVNRVNNSLKVWAVAITFNASQNTDVHSPLVLLQDIGSITEQSVTDGSSGIGNSLRIAGIIADNPSFQTFLDDPISPNILYPGISSTYRHGVDYGAQCSMVVTETTTGTGSRNIGFVGSTGYRAAVHAAIKDVAGPASTSIKDIISRGILVRAR